MRDVLTIAAVIVTSLFVIVFVFAITRPRRPRWNREAPNNAAIDSAISSTSGALHDDRDEWDDSSDDGSSDGGDGDGD